MFAVLFIALAVGVVFIVLLEIVSHMCTYPPKPYPDCQTLIEQYVPEEVRAQYGYPSTSLADQPSVEEVLSDRKYEVEQSAIDGLNGMACAPYIFIARELPGDARKYVALHEAYHVAGTDNETSANFRAAQKYPFGMIQTVVHSLVSGTRTSGSGGMVCPAGGAWKAFKVYFLGDSW